MRQRRCVRAHDCRASQARLTGKGKPAPRLPPLQRCGPKDAAEAPPHGKEQHQPEKHCNRAHRQAGGIPQCVVKQDVHQDRSKKGKRERDKTVGQKQKPAHQRTRKQRRSNGSSPSRSCTGAPAETAAAAHKPSADCPKPILNRSRQINCSRTLLVVYSRRCRKKRGAGGRTFLESTCGQEKPARNIATKASSKTLLRSAATNHALTRSPRLSLWRRPRGPGNPSRCSDCRLLPL